MTRTAVFDTGQGEEQALVTVFETGHITLAFRDTPSRSWGPPIQQTICSCESCWGPPPEESFV